MSRLPQLLNFNGLKLPQLIPSLKKRVVLALCLAGVLGIVFLVYFPSLQNGFVNWDDDVHLLNNPFVQNLGWSHLRDLLTTTVNKVYLPLTELSYSVEYHFFGGWPVIYHLDNLLCHLLVTGFVLLLTLRLGRSLLTAVLAALIFGLHPVHVEPVAWVTGRKDVLYGFFYLLALLNYCYYLGPLPTDNGGQAYLTLNRKAPGAKTFPLVATFVFGFASVLAKPMALSLPLILLLLDWYWKRKITFRSLLEKLFLGMLFIPIVWMTYHAHARVMDFRFPGSLLLWAWSFVFYLKSFFLPFHFALIYHVPEPITFGEPAYSGAVLIFVLFVAACIRFRKNRLLIFSAWFYFCSIFFLLRWDQRADVNIVADRFMYLPSIGFCVLAAELFVSILKKRWPNIYKRLLVLVLVLATILALGNKTDQQIKTWKSGVSLWENQLFREPSAVKALVYNKIAEAKMGDPGFQKVIEDYQIAKKAGGNLPRDKAKKIDEIILLYNAAVKIKPDYAGAFYNLGVLFDNLGETDLAERYYLRAISFDKQHFNAYYRLGLVYQSRHDYVSARKAFSEAMNINQMNEKLKKDVLKAIQAQNPF